MYSKSPLVDFWHSIRHMASHAAVTLIAVAIAFSLPKAASYILFNWWPRMQENGQMLLYAEIGFAALLVLLLNLVKLTWDYRRRARMTSIASLVYARESNDWLSRWVKDNQLKRLPWKRDLTIKAVTGYGTFAADDSALRKIIQDCYELRVMLLNPYGPGAEAYAAAHADPQATLVEIRREVAASIAALRRLQGPGKNISLKFYDDPPFWKLVFIGEHVWVRCCHGTRDADKFPEYVFAMQPKKPNRGFFPAFYTDFLNQWNDLRHPDYAFDTDELVYRHDKGGKARRAPYQGAETETVDVPQGQAVQAALAIS
jgi:hypothetical protein